MTAGLRLLFFWLSKDDVGGGYIRLGVNEKDPSVERVQLLIGSDPARAPRKINRWGAATEILRKNKGSGIFFGFMKPSKGTSISSMKGELAKEKAEGRHLFEGIISRVDATRALSMTVPVYSSIDFTMHQLPKAEQMVLENFKEMAGAPRHLEGSARTGCESTLGFLFTLREQITAAINGQKIPVYSCFIYHGRRYSLTLKKSRPIQEKKIAVKIRGQKKKSVRVYRNVREAEFQIVNRETGKHSKFKLLLGTSGDLRGVPIQIRYQPNWWFRVVLSLARISHQGS
jgi:hypothetical protein